MEWLLRSLGGHSKTCAGKRWIFLSFCTIMNWACKITYHLAAAIVWVIENLVGSFSFSQRCTELLSVGASETWPFPVLLPFDPSRHKLLPLYWATEEGFELRLLLSDLSEQSGLIGTAAGSLVLLWIKRNRKPRSLHLRDSSPQRGKKKDSDLILELNSKIIAVLKHVSIMVKFLIQWSKVNSKQVK